MAYKRHYMLLISLALAGTACMPTDAVAKQKHHAAVKAKHHAVVKARHHAVVKPRHRAVVKTKDRLHRVRPVASAGISFTPAHALSIFCDPSLWSHVYAGDPRRFSRPQDRLQIIQNCVSVTGTIESARPEKDGDFHIRLRLDPQYRSM